MNISTLKLKQGGRFDKNVPVPDKIRLELW